MINTTEIKGTWYELKGKFKKKFSILTDDDLQFESGMKDGMLGKLQIKLGKTQEELYEIIETL